MKLFEDESNNSSPHDQAAALVMEVVPQVMRLIRAEMRSHRTPDITVPQLRTLTFLSRNPGASLSDVAEHIGLTLPTVSKMIDRLEAQRMIARQDCADDRRRVQLSLTKTGQLVLSRAAAATQERLARLLAVLGPDDVATIVQAMHFLRVAVSSENGAPGDQIRKGKGNGNH